jgi:hypothetical protein
VRASEVCGGCRRGCVSRACGARGNRETTTRELRETCLRLSHDGDMGQPTHPTHQPPVHRATATHGNTQRVLLQRTQAAPPQRSHRARHRAGRRKGSVRNESVGRRGSICSRDQCAWQSAREERKDTAHHNVYTHQTLSHTRTHTHTHTLSHCHTDTVTPHTQHTVTQHTVTLSHSHTLSYALGWCPVSAHTHTHAPSREHTDAVVHTISHVELTARQCHAIWR